MGVSHEEHVPAYVPASCPCFLSSFPVHALCPRLMSSLPVPASCRRFLCTHMSSLPVHASCPRFMSLHHVLDSCPPAWADLLTSISAGIKAARGFGWSLVQRLQSPPCSLKAMIMFFYGIVVRSVFCQECHVDVHNQNTDSSTLFSDSSLPLFCLY